MAIKISHFYAFISAKSWGNTLIQSILNDIKCNLICKSVLGVTEAWRTCAVRLSTTKQDGCRYCLNGVREYMVGVQDLSHCPLA